MDRAKSRRFVYANRGSCRSLLARTVVRVVPQSFSANGHGCNVAVIHADHGRYCATAIRCGRVLCKYTENEGKRVLPFIGIMEP